MVNMKRSRIHRFTLLAAMTALVVLAASCRLDLSFDKRDGREDDVDAPETEGDQDTDVVDEEQAEAEPDTDDGPGDTETDGPPGCGNRVVDEGEECDDGNLIPGDGCEPGTCTWSCHDDPDCEDSDPCNGEDTCDAGTHACAHGAIAPEGTPCPDDLSCTLDESCDGEGRCVATLDDTACPSGQVCEPACFAGASGCGSPPASLAFSCRSPVTPSTVSVCSITLGTMTGQASCLACSAEVGPVLLDASDFGDAAGTCGTGGWTLLAGEGCATGYAMPACTPSGPPAACCDDPSTLCDVIDGSFVLRSNVASNCGGGFEEWRLSKTFSTAGLGALELGFDLGAAFLSTDGAVVVTLDDASNEETLLCGSIDLLATELGFSSGSKLLPVRLALPAWAEDNPAVTATFALGSGGDLNTLFLDNVSLRGWPLACPPTTLTLMTETFDACPDPIPDGWNGWTVTGSPSCPGFDCAGGEGDGFGPAANGRTWTMEHGVDATDLDGEVVLCFDLGESGANLDESILAEFSTDGGARWQAAWSLERDMTVDGRCARICVSLSDIDTGVRHNPALRIRFTLSSNNRSVTIDDVDVRGAVYCPAGSQVLLGPVTDTPSPGGYEVTVQDTGGQLSALVECRWGAPEHGRTGLDDVRFVEAP
jgi:cysteine-rich repeat protein